MTKKDYTALVFVIDASGSMHHIAADMKGAMEALLTEQKTLPGKLTVDTVYFNAPGRSFWPQYELVTNTWYVEQDHLADPEDVKIDIRPGGGTALLDAIGRKVTSFGRALAELPEDERPEKVIFAIVTDGEENSSREYSYAKIASMTKHQTDKYGWDFVYLGANQDAVAVAGTIGIAAGSALTYDTANVKGMAQSFNAYASATRTIGVAAFSQADRDANK